MFNSMVLDAQTELKKWELNGYVSNLQSAMFEEIDSSRWNTENTIHNRLNFFWYPSKQIKLSLQARNRLIYGDFVESFPGYKEMIDSDDGFLDLSENILDGQSYILNATLDRAYLQITQGDFEATIGRQRINWGQTFVWNPNDIFNTYSFFDVDYPERPGSDAVRLQYYTGYTSSVEISGKINHNEKLTLAGLWRFSKWDYDLQMLGGIMNEQDYIGGIGWSGYIKNASFRGEAIYAHPMDNPGDTTGVFVVSVGGDYTFANSLFIQVEALYNQLPGNSTIRGFESFYYQPLSAKRLSFTEYNFFVQASYPVTPLFNASLSGIYYPKYAGYFIGPNLTYSLTQNLKTSFIIQSFSGEFEQPGLQEKERRSVTMPYLRFKWSF
jgi:hypothetical protein